MTVLCEAWAVFARSRRLYEMGSAARDKARWHFCCDPLPPGFAIFCNLYAAAIFVIGGLLDPLPGARFRFWDCDLNLQRLAFASQYLCSDQDAQGAVNDLTGKWLGSRQIRCNWAPKGAGTSDDKQGSDSKSVVELIDGSSEYDKEAANSDAPENTPQYTTVHVGNLSPEIDLHRHFHALGAGSIEEVRVQRDKGFGFVRYSTHAEAAMSIQLGNTQSYLCGKPIKFFLKSLVSCAFYVDYIVQKVVCKTLFSSSYWVCL